MYGYPGYGGGCGCDGFGGGGFWIIIVIIIIFFVLFCGNGFCRNNNCNCCR